MTAAYFSDHGIDYAETKIVISFEHDRSNHRLQYRTKKR